MRLHSLEITFSQCSNWEGHKGYVLLPAFSRDIPFVEYAPRRIKQSITGNGSSSKEQVALMLQRILKFEDMPKYLDATDALAAALCYINQRDIVYEETTPAKPKSKKASWASFVSDNPNKVKVISKIWLILVPQLLSLP